MGSNSNSKNAIVTSAALAVIAIVYLYKKSKEGKEECIYLDYNGTTPIQRKVYESMIPYLTNHFGNPSSTHYYGREPSRAIKNARLSIARYLCKHSTDNDIESIASNIIFTGCGTESNNLAIYLAIKSYQAGNHRQYEHKHHHDQQELPHVITTNVEHPAILQCLKYYEHAKEITVTYIPVDHNCLINPNHVEAAITKTTCLVTIMYANNEIGTIMPIVEVARLCKKHGILFHTDAAQCIGKTSEFRFDMDMVTIVGHKIGAPKGISALYVRKASFIDQTHQYPSRKLPYLVGESGGMLLGGGQEFGYRAGTENVPYIVGLGTAIDIITQQEDSESNDYYDRYRYLATTLYNLLQEYIGKDDIVLHGPSINDTKRRLSNTISIGIKNIHSGLLLHNIKDLVAASAGSACHSSSSYEDASYSNILKVMGVPKEYALGTVRLSVGFDTTLEDVERAAKIISDGVLCMRNT